MDTKPRVAFLIPIPSSRVVRDWPLACSYLRQTLASIFNSSNGNFCVVVAGHEAPDFDLPQDPRFKFLSLDHPVLPQTQDTWVYKVRDKLTKIAGAWNYAKAAWHPDYVMKVDWDDLISFKLVDWLVKARDEAGFRVTDGWFWRSGSRHLIQHSETFDLISGTCLIIKSDLADIKGPFLDKPGGVELGNPDYQIDPPDSPSLMPRTGIGTLLLNDNHGYAADQFQYLGHQLGTVPFRAVVYRLGNPQSVSRNGLKSETIRHLFGRIRRTRFITPKLRKEFMLE